MINDGTYDFDNGVYKFTVVIENGEPVLVTLDAPKAMTLADFFNPENWTEETAP